MKKLCDLHTHSCFSDGTFTPEQLIDAAEVAGLSAIALCDHNTVLGLPRFLAAAQGRSVEAVAGAEFSTDYRGTELHILGLLIPPERFEAVTALMEPVHRRKEQSNRELVETLRRAGYAVDFERIKSKAPSGQFNRVSIAVELMELGYIGSVKEAFSTLLSSKGGYYRPPKHIDAFEMIGLIRSMGAVPVLAHPFLDLKEEAALRGFLGPAKEAGLVGMEVRYPRFDEKTTDLAASLAEEYGLRSSGGSDFHGTNKPDIRLGKGAGSLEVPLSFLDGLKKSLYTM